MQLAAPRSPCTTNPTAAPAASGEICAQNLVLLSGRWLPLNNEQGISFVLEMFRLSSMLSLSADHRAARRGPGVLRTYGVSLQNVFFAFSSASNSKA